MNGIRYRPHYTTEHDASVGRVTESLLIPRHKHLRRIASVTATAHASGDPSLATTAINTGPLPIALLRPSAVLGVWDVGMAGSSAISIEK